MQYFCMILIQYSEYLVVSTVDTNGLVLKHQDISSYSADFTHVPFELLMG